MNPVKYLFQVREEMVKVTWPKKGEVVKLTILVILISLIVGLYLTGIDLGLTKLLSIILTKK